MMLAFISDVHGNLPALEAVMDELDGLEVYCVGDVVGYYPWPNEACGVVGRRCVGCVLGNHDYAVVSGDVSGFNEWAAAAVVWTRDRVSRGSVSFLASLPRRMEAEGFCMVHGSPRDPLEEYVYPGHPYLASFFDSVESSVLVLGHTHVPFVRYLDGGRIVFNPGSVGQPRDGDWRASYAIFDADSMRVELRRVEYDVGRVADAVVDAGLPRSLASRLYAGL
jgi:putative phosphoesterase